MNEKLEAIRSKCIEANSEIREYHNRCMTCGYGFEFCRCTPKRTEWYIDRGIQLADVLLAIGKGSFGLGFHKVVLSADNLELLVEDPHDRDQDIAKIFWNLRKDDLNKQSEETIDFLTDLLR